MQYKSLSLAVTAALTLAGCGGGSSGDIFTDGGNANGFQQLADIRVYHDIQNNKISQSTSIMTITKDGKAYDDSSSTVLSFIVTKNGLYDESSVKDTYGKLIGAASVSKNQLTLYPYSSIGSKGLAFTTNYSILNIGGQGMAEKIAPFPYWVAVNKLGSKYAYSQRYLDFLLYLNKMKFPANTQCMQSIEETSSEDRLFIKDITENNPAEQAFLKKQWEDYSTRNSPNISKIIYKDSIAYSLFDPFNKTTQTVVQYKDYTYYSAVHKKAGIGYSLQQELDKIAANPDFDKVSANLRDQYRSLLQKSCTSFAPTVKAALQQHINTFNQTMK